MHSDLTHLHQELLVCNRLFKVIPVVHFSVQMVGHFSVQFDTVGKLHGFMYAEPLC